MSARESTAVAHGGAGQCREREGDKIGAIGHFREAKFIYDQMGLAQDSKQMLEPHVCALAQHPRMKVRRTREAYFRQTASGSNAPPSAA